MTHQICPQASNALPPPKPMKSRPLPSIPPTHRQTSGYSELYHEETECLICFEIHLAGNSCPSKPRFHPNRLYLPCDICNGHHPLGNCHWEYLRSSLITPSKCKFCKGLIHVGFCQGSLFCTKCRTNHNSRAGCIKRELHDLSNNICPQCKTFHSLHCPRDLQKLLPDNYLSALWCNRCKIFHLFMLCTPFCNKCFRHHEERPTCPDPYDFCTVCHVSHYKRSCPFSSPSSPSTPTTSRTGPEDPKHLRRQRLFVNQPESGQDSPPRLR